MKNGTVELTDLDAFLDEMMYQTPGRYTTLSEFKRLWDAWIIAKGVAHYAEYPWSRQLLRQRLEEECSVRIVGKVNDCVLLNWQIPGAGK